ncbi:hypothetical protein HRR83_002203 [Exophiala dermatitidis]|uniref:Uncharacterized protein n=1 Tax=Exophiala dermatitidis TaxID=5970 RepID=A0AAN6J003_EXODE|nr:hypothetical protein HRR74_002280 [Exophiala dermatitidis]KAJ4525643.1 hypothetical protein HRR73_002375 [Exophiala dermatitidis]KAJ4536960.1 hypothetical protein HRR76_004987 [Exophiala dermatitidis]KAJ4555437.1 hypothetical protein HRR77_001367 [Exophiala dermatitidis]KAJ4572246.1 hypothetical protein HRR79_003452 [Exophiala dermatitidis]
MSPEGCTPRCAYTAEDTSLDVDDRGEALFRCIGSMNVTSTKYTGLQHEHRMVLLFWRVHRLTLSMGVCKYLKRSTTGGSSNLAPGLFFQFWRVYWRDELNIGFP